VDALAQDYTAFSPYNYTLNNPIRFIDPDGRVIMLPGDKAAQDAYVSMLNNSTGNIYQITDNQLSLVGANKDFTGNKSQALINSIQSGMDSKDVYSLSLVGATSDDKSVFIDSYTEGKIDVSDLGKLGEANTALQGAAIGHFLNEVQEAAGYSTADSKAREAMFEGAHKPSLAVEGKIYGELVGDKSITTRIDYSTSAPKNGYQSVIFKYNENNKYSLKQGATSTTKKITIDIGGVSFPSTETTVTPNGELNSVKRIK
jgi:hypothetical protein